jgi:hypothetical protein
MERAMNRTQMVLVTGGLALAAAAAWMLLRPVTPVDTPYFQWRAGPEGRYQLVVGETAGVPEFRRGVTTTPVPQSGTLRVVGNAAPGAVVEVHNPRTGRAFRTTADADGAFAVDAEVRRGDELRLLSRTITFRGLEVTPHSSAVVSSP